MYQHNRQAIASYEEELLIVEDRLTQLESFPLKETLPDLNKLKQELSELKSKITKQQ